jgi:Mn2+/Fe2+ NRAMP family transporter
MAVSNDALDVRLREDLIRQDFRSAVRDARRSKRPLWLLFLLAGPGILVMLGENDGPSMLSYAATGATYGIGFFIPFILLTFLMAYVVQEMTLRIGIATNRGHAELIYRRFGPFWGRFAMVELAVGNALTLITEFIAIRAGAAYFGIPAWEAVLGAVIAASAVLMGRRYFTWERAVIALAVGNLLFVPAALFAHPDATALARALAFLGPLPGNANAHFWTLVLADIGATVTPWMIFFQQSAIVDKGLTKADLPHARLDTALGAAIAAVVAVATVVAAAPLYTHHVNVSAFNGGADFATALRPYIGSTGAALFALGMIEAGVVAVMTISTSSAYTIGEVLSRAHSFNAPFKGGAAFYISILASVAFAAAVVLIPNAPLLPITLAVNVLATLLMAPALLFVLLLVNDRPIMSGLHNRLISNVAGYAIIVGISVLAAAYGTTTAVSAFLER